MDPVLVAEGIVFSYRPGVKVLSGVSLSLRAGELLGVFGPNAAGKTTLLGLLSASLRPAEGRVLLLGRNAHKMSARERARLIAVVPQEPRVAFPFTVLEIALMGRAPYLSRFQMERPGDIAIAREALEMTGLSGLENRRFFELSGGEKRRVMIAKALAQQSRILLLDEPTAFLDLRRQVEIYKLVQRLVKEKGLAAIAVSHDVNLTAAYSDRVAVLAEGKIISEGPPAEVLSARLVEKVYGVRVEVLEHPKSPGTRFVVPAEDAADGKSGKQG